ncbi:MAG: hypothetical protein HY273_10010, partial [Gammaproteobacteria bacterium]|nr:hypothetical protein [Gammaproteobacteria bacterium]
GCSDDIPIYRYTPQQWNNVIITIEARPGPTAGSVCEFLIMASFANNTPAHSIRVSIRMNDQGPWKQAIQDGMVGVYRRSDRVNNLDTDVLEVQLKRNDEEGVLRFALKDRQL